MQELKRLVTAGLLLAGVMVGMSGCVVATHDHEGGGYREGYYDGQHHRYWHENGWHECADRDEHCH